MIELIVENDEKEQKMMKQYVKDIVLGIFLLSLFFLLFVIVLLIGRDL